LGPVAATKVCLSTNGSQFEPKPAFPNLFMTRKKPKSTPETKKQPKNKPAENKGEWKKNHNREQQPAEPASETFKI
jgi:hypothetical protein